MRVSRHVRTPVRTVCRGPALAGYTATAHRKLARYLKLSSFFGVELKNHSIFSYSRQPQSFSGRTPDAAATWKMLPNISIEVRATRATQESKVSFFSIIFYCRVGVVLVFYRCTCGKPGITPQSLAVLYNKYLISTDSRVQKLELIRARSVTVSPGKLGLELQRV